MPCTHCDHCRARAERADLLLSATSPRSIPGGIDRAFYGDFGRVYDLARSRTGQAVRLLLEVNPGLGNRERVGQYIKRARALGYVTTPARSEQPPAQPQPSEVAGREHTSVEPEVPIVDDGDEVQRSIAAAQVRAEWTSCAGAPPELHPALREQWRDGIPVRPTHLIAYRLAANEGAAAAYLDQLVADGLGTVERLGVRLHARGAE